MEYMSDRGEFRKFTGVGTIAHLVQKNLRNIKIPISSSEVMKKYDDLINKLNSIKDNLHSKLDQNKDFFTIMEVIMRD